MALSVQQKTSIQDFETFTKLPQNSEKIFELFDGEIIEVPSNPYVSEIANLIGFFIRQFLRENKLRGHVTGEAGGYIINGDVFAPDVAYISYERQPQLAKRGYNPNPPEIAVEVISDTTSSQEQNTLRRKVTNYLNASVMVWVVNPEERTIEVHELGKTVTLLNQSDTLSAGDILPHFELALGDILPDELSS